MNRRGFIKGLFGAAVAGSAATVVADKPALARQPVMLHGTERITPMTPDELLGLLREIDQRFCEAAKACPPLAGFDDYHWSP